jgi:anti-sigma regulatory factor (Ser/Thr protein kinase)
MTLDVTGRGGYRHEAFLYDRLDDVVDQTRAFVDEGTSEGEHVLVVLEKTKLDALRRAVSPSPLVHFADMNEVGANPAHIIPMWQDFLDDFAGVGRPVRGVGEPIWPGGRCPSALIECQRHEALLNVAFGGSPDLWLLCPYDLRLGENVIDEAIRSHPWVHADGGSHVSGRYHEPSTMFDDPLTVPPVTALTFDYDERSLVHLRRFLDRESIALGLPERRAQDLVLAANELATNTVRHADGRGTAILWRKDDAVLCEIRDGGFIADPLVGRRRPPHDAADGRGVWLVNQLCDLVQLRTSPAGTTVRLHMRLGDQP